MKLSLKELMYLTLLIFIFLVIKLESKPPYWYVFGVLLLALFIYVDRNYAHKERKAYLIYVVLAAVMIILLPKISLVALIWIIPGLFLTYLISKNYTASHKLNLKDRLFMGILFSLLLLLSSVLLSYLGVSVGRGFLLLLFCLPLVVLFFKSIRGKITEEITGLTVNYKLILSLLLLFSVTLWVYSPFLKDALPQTTAADYFATGKYVENSLLENKEFPTWEIKNTLGQARYTLDTPLYFWISGVTGVLVGKGLLYIYNPLFLFLTLLFVGGLYLCFFKLSGNNIISVLGAALFMTSAKIGVSLGAAGNMKAFVSFSLAMIAFYFFARFYQTRKIFFLIFIVLGSELALLTHIAPIHLLFSIAIVSAIVLIQERKNIIFKEFLHFSVILFLIVVFISFWALPFMHYQFSNLNGIKAQSHLDFLSYLNDNLFLYLVFTFSFLVLLWFVWKKEEKISLALVGAIPLLFMIPYVYQSKLFFNIFALLKMVEFPKAEVMFFLATVITFIILLKNCLNSKTIWIRRAGWIGILVGLIILCSSGYQLHNSFSGTVSEQIQTGRVFTNEFNFMKTLPPGNAFTAGVFGLAIDGVFYEFTNHPALGVGFSESYLQYRIRFDDGHTFHENTREYVSNILRLAGVRYLFVNRCSPSSNVLFQELFSETYIKNIPDTEYTLLSTLKSDCFVIFELSNSPLVKRIKLAQIGFSEAEQKDTECILVDHLFCLPTPKYDKQLYNRVDGYNIIWIDNINSKTDYLLNNISQKIPPADGIALELVRKSDTEIIISGEMQNEWIYLAESYFPRWKAFDQNGKELEIQKTNLGTIVIKVENPINNIRLKYAFPTWEKGLYFCSLLSLITMFVCLSIWNKKTE